MEDLKKLLPGYFYHIYNRGNNKENIFIEPANYAYFLSLWLKYIHPIAETYAYTLLRNHFHALVYIRPLPYLLALPGFQSVQNDSLQLSNQLSRRFSDLFNAYAKAINKRYHRTGSLFQERFRRKLVMGNDYLTEVILYIHTNAQKHGFASKEEIYQHTSYPSLLCDKPTRLQRQKVLQLFGGCDAFAEAHRCYSEKIELRKFFLETDEDDD